MNTLLIKPRNKQRGAIMVVSLLLLLVMTVLALTASQSTTLQERMAGNARDTDLAFQAAEAGLRDAEGTLINQVKSKSTVSECGKVTDDSIKDGSCVVQQRDINFKPDFSRAEDSFWSKNSREYAGDNDALDKVIKDPQIFTEVRGNIPDSLSRGGPNPDTGVAYYTHTVRAKGGTDSSTVVLQSVDAVRYTAK